MITADGTEYFLVPDLVPGHKYIVAVTGEDGSVTALAAREKGAISLCWSFDNSSMGPSDSRDSATFEWVNKGDADRNILAFIRRNPWNYDGAVLVVLNFSPVSYHDYSACVPFGGLYKRVFSTYDSLPGQGNPAEIGGIPPLTAAWQECDGYSHRLPYSLRPFESVIFEFPT